tara:strand:+ start:1131 stop:1508 length:378 start_codon:yes stop_codon:yes gene_type:complete
MNKNNVYKILREHEWEEAQKSGQIITELDKQDGFVHLSTGFQLAATLAFFFKESNSLQLLQLDLGKIDDNQLIYEASYPNEGKRKSSFPHLYSKLMTNQVSKNWTIERGAFDLPEEVILLAENGY